MASNRLLCRGWFDGGGESGAGGGDEGGGGGERYRECFGDGLGLGVY
jgi:hypothetical protein